MAWKKAHLIVAILGFSLFAQNAYAQVSYKKYSYFENYGGLNDSLSGITIKDNEATAINNIVFDTAGAITKRYGYQNIEPTTGNVYQVGSANNAITGLTSYVNQTTGSHYLVAIANVSGQATAFEKQLDASNSVPGGPWVNIGGAGILPSNYTNDEQPVFTKASNQVVMAFPAFTGFKPFAWQATGNVYTLTGDINIEPAKIVSYFNNILFEAGNPAQPWRVRYSDLTNGITSWNPTDFFDLDRNNGHYVTALFNAYGNLYIFEDNSIWMLTGTSDANFALQKMITNVGTLSPHSISLVNNNIYFITSQNDIAVYDGVFTVKYLSSKIRNTIGANNFNRASEALGIGYSSYKYKDLDYYVSETTVGSNTNNQILLFDTDRQAWTKFSNWAPNAWTVLGSSSGQDVLVWGDYSGNVYSYPNIGTYNDVSNSCVASNCTVTSPAIAASYTTKWFLFPDVSLGDKYLRILKTYIQNSSLPSTLTTTVNNDYNLQGQVYNYNYTISGSMWDQALWDSSIWGGGAPLNIDREEPNLGHNMFQLQYSNAVAGQDMTILGFELFVEPTTNV